MTILELFLLLAVGGLAGVINSVSSGGSFFTYPAMLAVGLAPLDASVTTLAALTPANLAAVPEYWPEVVAERVRYRQLVPLVVGGAMVGIVLLFATGADGFEALVPWLVLGATVLFGISPAVRRWAEAHAPSMTDGRVGVAVLFVLSIYLTYFGSGVGHLFLAMLTIRGFGNFLSANAAKNIAIALGTTIATVAYTLAGWVHWWHAVPVAVASAIGARWGSRFARRVPVSALRWFVIAFGTFVAAWLFIK